MHLTKLIYASNNEKMVKKNNQNQLKKKIIFYLKSTIWCDEKGK
jgi:hypothetical protein